jgi:hypothetical protein
MVLDCIIDIQAEMTHHYRHEPAMRGIALEHREQVSPGAPCGYQKPIELFVRQPTYALP